MAECIVCLKPDCEDEEHRQTSLAVIALERRLTSRTWFPIETAPKDGTQVLLLVPNWGKPDQGTHCVVAQWSDDTDDECKWVRDPGDEFSNTWPPTHWMPLPEPPNG